MSMNKTWPISNFASGNARTSYDFILSGNLPLNEANQSKTPDFDPGHLLSRHVKLTLNSQLFFGNQRLTRRKYASYSAPKVCRKVGSSYNTTNRWVIRKNKPR